MFILFLIKYNILIHIQSAFNYVALYVFSESSLWPNLRIVPSTSKKAIFIIYFSPTTKTRMKSYQYDNKNWSCFIVKNEATPTIYLNTIFLIFQRMETLTARTPGQALGIVGIYLVDPVLSFEHLPLSL